MSNMWVYNHMASRGGGSDDDLEKELLLYSIFLGIIAAAGIGIEALVNKGTTEKPLTPIETESEQITESESTNILQKKYKKITAYVDGQIHTVKDVWYEGTEDDTIVYGSLEDGTPFVSKLKDLIDFQKLHSKNQHTKKLARIK